MLSFWENKDKLAFQTAPVEVSAITTYTSQLGYTFLSGWPACRLLWVLGGMFGVQNSSPTSLLMAEHDSYYFTQCSMRSLSHLATADTQTVIVWEWDWSLCWPDWSWVLSRWINRQHFLPWYRSSLLCTCQSPTCSHCVYAAIPGISMCFPYWYFLYLSILFCPMIPVPRDGQDNSRGWCRAIPRHSCRYFPLFVS